MLCRLADAVLVLSTDPEDVLFQGYELAGLEGCVFHRGWQLYPLLFVSLPTLYNVVSNGRTAVIPGRVPSHNTWFIGDLGNVEGSWRARFILRGGEGWWLSQFSVLFILQHCLLFHYSINTKNVDIDGGGGASTDVDCLNDVGGGVSSGGVANAQLGVSRLGVNGDAVISP